MKKTSTILAGLALVALLAAPVWAGPGRGVGPGPGGGPSYQQLTPDQRAQADKARAAFLKDTEVMRTQLATKKEQLKTLRAQPGASPAQIKALSDEIVDLKAKIAKKRNEYAAGLPQSLVRKW